MGKCHFAKALIITILSFLCYPIFPQFYSHSRLQKRLLNQLIGRRFLFYH